MVDRPALTKRDLGASCFRRKPIQPLPGLQLFAPEEANIISLSTNSADSSQTSTPTPYPYSQSFSPPILSPLLLQLGKVLMQKLPWEEGIFSAAQNFRISLCSQWGSLKFGGRKWPRTNPHNVKITGSCVYQPGLWQHSQPKVISGAAESFGQGT